MSDLSLSDLTLSDLSLSDASPYRTISMSGTAHPGLSRSSAQPTAQSNIGYGPRFRKSVFLLSRTPDKFQPIEQILTQLKCEVRAIDRTDHLTEFSQTAPCLVIVADADPQWVNEAVAALRQTLVHPPVTVVVLEDQRDMATALTQPSAIDGYLFQPLDRCVLGSLIHAAAVRQFC
jgi:response regulator RpfG family c-di-GMP phosphodiesterase